MYRKFKGWKEKTKSSLKEESEEEKGKKKISYVNFIKEIPLNHTFVLVPTLLPKNNSVKTEVDRNTDSFIKLG